MRAGYMIQYKFSEESVYVNYYAKKLNDSVTLEILRRGEVLSAEEATRLSHFFWRMVDASIDDEKNDVSLPWSESVGFWNEKLMTSLSGYLERAGYETQWNQVVDEL